MQSTQTEPVAAGAKHRVHAGRKIDYRAAWRRAVRPLRDVPRPGASTLVWLGVAVLLCPPVLWMPGVGLDLSWVTAINIAGDRGLRFGDDIVFTYGPWGFLEAPTGLSARTLVLGTLFAIAGAVALYVALYLALARHLSPRFAAPVAAAATAAAAPVAAGGRFVCAAMVASVLLLLHDGRDPRLRLWATVALSIIAALLAQVKASHGVMTLVLAAIVALSARSGRAAAQNAGAGVAAGIVAFGVFWLLAGQHLGDIPAYLRTSMEFTLGYSEAMQLEHRGRAGYLLGALLALAVGVAVVQAVRHRRRAVGTGLALLAAAMVWLAAKHGFSRHEPGHENIYIVMAALLLVALTSGLARRGRIYLVVALCAMLQVAALPTFDPFTAQRTWRSILESSLHGYADEKAASIADTRAGYAVPQELLEIVGDDPVHVDPWDAAVPWAYDLRWSPVPVFQQYTAYTPYLDELNARAVVDAPGDQMILRNNAVALDGRNQVWDPPRYQLAVLCDYAPVATVGDWSVLRHGADRCSAPRDLGTQHIDAGEIVAVPGVAADEVLVAHFTPDPDDVLVRALELVYKPWRTVYITADGTRFRVPKAHLAGPLLLSVPSAGDAATPYAGFSYAEISVNISGTIRFEAVALA